MTASPWTEEDVRAANRAYDFTPYTASENQAMRNALAALAPRVAELQRAAKVEALRGAAGDPRLVASVAAVIADPNATTPRLPNEQVTEWTARAVLAALAVAA